MTIRAVVVGGTSGIGYAMACRIAAGRPSSDTVVISGRTKPADIPHANIEFRALDATSMRQVKQYTDDLKAASPKLDLLVMTQGIMSTAGRTETPEGIDQKMAIHYYSKQLLIRELLPVLDDAARVITVYDGWLGSPSKLIWEDLDLKTHFSLAKAADHCTSMTDAMVQYWAKATAQPERPADARPHFVHAFPGGVNTNIMRDVVPSFLQGAMKAVGKVVLTSPDACAERLLNGAEQRAAEGRGEQRFWSNIDSKGRVMKKAVWSDEQLDKLSKHTWGIIDKALGTKSSGLGS